MAWRQKVHIDMRPPAVIKKPDNMIFAAAIQINGVLGAYWPLVPPTDNQTCYHNNFRQFNTIAMPVPGTFSKMHVIEDAAAGTGGDHYTLVIGDDTVLLQVDIATGESTGDSGTTTGHCNAGDPLAYYISLDSSMNQNMVYFSCVFTPD